MKWENLNFGILEMSYILKLRQNLLDHTKIFHTFKVYSNGFEFRAIELL